MHPGYTPNQEEEVQYEYDVFVCYSSNDSDWVKQVLLPELENNSEPPFRVCEYERNWLAGQNLFQCITESIEKSRKVLFIVTNSFVRSRWCQIELTFAQEHLMDKDNDNTILAIMEEIEPENMAPNLLLEMKRKVYMEWTNDELGQRLFFQKMKQSLRSKGSSITRAMPFSQLIHSY